MKGLKAIATLVVVVTWAAIAVYVAYLALVAAASSPLY